MSERALSEFTHESMAIIRSNCIRRLGISGAAMHSETYKETTSGGGPEL